MFDTGWFLSFHRQAEQACLSLLLFLYPADSQQDSSSLQPGSCSRFLPVKKDCFLRTVLTWGFQALGF